MNTYPTTPEQLYLEQKMRDDNNHDPFYENEMARHNLYRKTEQQKKEMEERAEKWKKDQIAGYASKRYDFPEYQWWMIQDGKKYYRSSCNWNVYDSTTSSVIVGTWNEVSQRIEFCNDLQRKVQELEELVAKLTASIVA